ncbi:MAG: hypothetical protein ACREXU_13875, partial [Gammaproteobacteria bacterium]
MPAPKKVVLLDTHAWLWLVEGEARFSPETLGRIEAAAAARLLRIAPISVWEVAMLEAKGRIRLTQDCRSCLSPRTPASLGASRDSSWRTGGRSARRHPSACASS